MMNEKKIVHKEFEKHSRKARFWTKVGLKADKKPNNKIAVKISDIADDRSKTEMLIMTVTLKRYIELCARG